MINSTNMFRTGFNANNSFRQRSPIPDGVVASIDNLTDRESEIINQIKARVGIPVKIDLGREFETAKGTFTLQSMGFTSTGATGDARNRVFLLSRQMLADMAADDTRYRDIMASIENAIALENENQAKFVNVQNSLILTQSERFAHQMKLRMMSNLIPLD
jgi:hypothetical protein